MRKIKILYIIDKLGLAGAQNHLREVVLNLDKTKFETKLITLKEFGVKKIYGVSGIKGLIKLVKLIKTERFDIVHTYLFSENILGTIAAKISGTPIIITGRRDTGMLREGKWKHILAYKITNNYVDKIMSVCDAVSKKIKNKEKVRDDKLITIYNGVDFNRFQSQNNRMQVKKSLGIKENEFVVGMIANFSWIKGHEDFIGSAQIILSKRPDVKFLLAGDGPLKNSLQLAVSAQKLENKILFLGKREDIPELLSITDVSVNASYSEGMSNTILESMAAGVPVVATDVDGNAEIVLDGITGILVPVKNPQMLAGAIIELIQNKERATKLGENARKMIQENFTSEIMVRNIENMYCQLLQPKIAYILSQFPETHETFILREITAVRKNGINPLILSLKPCRDKIIHPEAGELMKQVIYGKINVSGLLLYVLMHPIKISTTLLYVFNSYWKNPKDFIKALYVWLECFYFLKAIKKHKITHIHSHWATMPTTAAMVLNKLTGIPFSFTAHAWDIFISQLGLEQKTKKAKFVATCTDYNRKFLSSFSNNGEAGKIHLNYHGLDLKEFNLLQRASEAKPLNILAIGRIVETKGFKYLIEACNILKNKGINFECLIVGDGPLRKEMEFLIQSSNLTDKVKLQGVKSQVEIKSLFENTSMFVQPSVIARNKDRDGIPNVILEALAFGIPVVATDISGIPEVIIDKKTGFVVPERNSMALAEAIENLHNNQAWQKEFSSNGRRLIEEKFDTDRNTIELIDLFKKYGAI